MPIQTAYASRISPSYEGMIANSEPHDIISKLVETAAGIGFGKVVVQGAADDQVRVAEVGRAFRGISEASHAADINPNADLYPQYAIIPVIVKGVVWVVASVAVAVGQPAYFVPATGVLTNVATANTLIPNAIWESSTTGAGLAKLRLG